MISEGDVLFCARWAGVNDMLKVTVDLFSAGTAGAGVTAYAVDTVDPAFELFVVKFVDT